MSRITIYGNKKDRKSVLEYLQRRRILDISEPDTEDFNTEFLSTSTSDLQSEFFRERSVGEKALGVLERYIPEKNGMFSSLKGKKSLSVNEYYSYVENIPEILRIAKRIVELSDEISERHGEIAKCYAAIEELSPWLGLDIPFDYNGTKNTVCITGTFSELLTAEEAAEKYDEQENVPPVYIEVVSKEPQQTRVFIIYAKKDAEECEKGLRAIGFSKPKSVYSGIPREKTEQCYKKITELESEIERLEKEVKLYEGAATALKFLVDYYAMRTEKYRILERIHQSKHIFIISGYVPESEAQGLAAKLEQSYNAAVELEAADEDAPVLLRNAYLTESVEPIVETFALPSKGEIDPTSIMAFFYYVFFGLMLSDAAYGLIIVIGCGVALAKFKDMDSVMRKTLRMFMYCGISTVIWGVLFGSYFGDVIAVVSSTFFGREITIQPLWFEPVNDPMRMLMFSFLLGLIHLFTGLGIKLYQYIRINDYMSAFTDCICWFMLVGGGVVYLFGVDMFLSMAGINAKLPKVWANTAAVIAGVGALGILLFSARRGSVGKRLAKGAYTLYGVTGWLSDILSYSRLLALGLATGVIATVFNKMGSMAGGGVLGAILFTVVFIAGHLLNIGVNLLGAYVHTNRLQFVEFFGKFYEGGGRAFRPFEENTKYYKIKE